MTRKTDSEIEQWVLRELGLGEIHSREVSVLARDGVITLRGSGQTYQDKLAVEEATRRATGVVGVVNEMRVKSSTALIEKVPFISVQSPGVGSAQTDSLIGSKDGRGVKTSQLNYQMMLEPEFEKELVRDG